MVHLDTILGPARYVNFLRGKIYAPNLSQPTWFVEGLAVLMESRQTTGGRVRSSFFDMELRVPFLEGKMLGLDAVSNGPLAFPQGSAIYLYGSSLLKYIEDRYGPDKIREISHRYASQLIPGGLNRVSREAIGRGYDQLWEDWKESLGRRYALQVEEATRRGLTPTTRLTFDGQGPREGLNPHYFHDGRGFVYQKATTTEHPAYVLLDPVSGKSRELMEVYSGGVAAPTPDGRALIFQRTNFQPLRHRISGASDVSWDDLFRVDLEIGRGARADARASRARARRLARRHADRVHRRHAPGGATWRSCPSPAARPKVLAGDQPGLAYGPSWSPDGRQIAYSRCKPGGLPRHPRLRPGRRGATARSGSTAPWTWTRATRPTGGSSSFRRTAPASTTCSPTSSRPSASIRSRTCVSGAFQPTVSPDGKRVVFTGFTSLGFDVFSAAFDPATWTLASRSPTRAPTRCR